MKYLIIFPVLLSALFGYNYHGCYLAPDNQTGWVACLDTSLVFKTTNGGQTWGLQTLPAGNKTIYDITGTDPAHAWTSGDLGQVMYTNNGGSSWVIQPVNLSKNATRIQFQDTLIGWIVGGNGTIGRTVDGGNDWEQNFSPHFAAEYYGLSFIDSLHGWIVAGYPDSLMTGQGYIDRSTDGGIMWDSLYQSSGYEDYFDVEFLNVNEGVVVGGNDNTYAAIIMKSTNGGISWSTVPSPANTFYLRALDFYGNNGWAVGRFGSIIHTTDAGNSWSFQTNPATTTLFDVDFSDNLHGIACGQNIILYTTDGGQTWNPAGLEENNTHRAAKIHLQVSPNPIRNNMTIRFTMQDSGPMISDTRKMTLLIYDINGRLVKDLSSCLGSGIMDHVSWSGTDQSGQRVPAGIYIACLSREDASAQVKLVLIE